MATLREETPEIANEIDSNYAEVTICLHKKNQQCNKDFDMK